MTSSRAPRYRVTVHELHDGKTTKVIGAYGSAFITAVATLQGDIMEVHFGRRREHIVAAIADEYSPDKGANALRPAKRSGTCPPATSTPTASG